jgi:hypothetical protein
MSSGLAVGVVLAVACLAYVLYPLVRPGTREARSTTSRSGDPLALRQVTDEEIEEAISVYRSRHSGQAACAVCGNRPEPDAIYCSSCGRRLADAIGTR